MSRKRDIYKRAHAISFLKNEETTFKLAARSSKHLLLLNPLIGFRLAVRVVAKREVLYSNELTHVNLDRGNTVLLSQVWRRGILDLVFKLYMLCVAKYSESSDRTEVFWLTFLIYQDVSFDMFLKRVNAKKILAGHASRHASIPPRAGRVSVLVARASHVTYCLRFRLAQRYLQGVNQRAFTNRNRTNWRGRVSAAPRPWSLTPFLQDPRIGTTVCVIDHWKHKIFSSYLSVFFPSYSTDYGAK